MSRFVNTFLSFSVAIIFLAFVSSTVSASTVKLQFSGLNLQYNDDVVNDRYDIYDSEDHDGRDLSEMDPSLSDELNSAAFFVDGGSAVNGVTFVDGLYIDLFVKDVNIPTTTGTVSSAGNGDKFGLDVWYNDPSTTSTVNDWHLQLNFDVVQVDVFVDGATLITLSVGGEASSLESQDLPFGLAYDTNFEIDIVLSSTSFVGIPTTNTGGTLYTSIDASGVGDIAGTLIPEPSSILLTVLGGLGLIAIGFRKRRR